MLDDETSKCSDCGESFWEGGDYCPDCLEARTCEECGNFDSDLFDSLCVGCKAAQREDEAVDGYHVVLKGLPKAFQRLGADVQIITEQCCGTCSSAAHDPEQFPDGYVYYHAQDIERAQESGELCVGFGNSSERQDRVEGLALALASAINGVPSLALEWEGSTAKRMSVSARD